MSNAWMIRLLGAVVVAAAGVTLAVLLGATPSAALAALLAGVAAFALAPGYDRPPPARADRADALGGDRGLPSAAALLTAFDEPVLVVRERRVVAANPAARSLFGAELEGADVRLAIRHPTAAHHLLDPLDPEEGSRAEIVGIGNDDRSWEMTVRAFPDGIRIMRLVDLGEARAAEKMRADFVANASHELRTPLASLLGFIETLEDDKAGGDPETRRRFLGIMLDEARRMRSLVDDLMSLSRIEAERFAAPTDPVDMRQVMASVLDAVGPLSERRECPVVIEVETDRTLVPGDRSQLVQLMCNLVTNAINYGKAGRPVRVRLDDGSGGLLRICVVDEGEGIAAEHIPRLTERFYRVDPGRSRAVGGTGLGLAIAKHIALRHQGRMEIRSRPGEGTSVRVHLPRADRRP